MARSYRGKVKARSFQNRLFNETINSQVITVRDYDHQGKILLAYGTAAASTQDAQNRYAKGAVYIKSDVSTGTAARYENVGTSGSSSFDLMGGVDSGDIADDAVTTAKIAGNAVTTPKINANAINASKVANSAGTGGQFIQEYVLAVYDFAVDGGGQGTITLADSGTFVDNCVIKLESVDVLTTFTSNSGNDAATIKVGTADGDLSTAIVISDAGNPWDAGVKDASIYTPIEGKTTTSRTVQMTIAGGEDLEAGKAVFKFAYWVSQ